ncbi:MAG: response regulator [Candidatus Marinimicrobia bacterium]|nr:response regulator [Candidatus Neomarinimicrobiota bacterium]MBL7046651.1 response regulator [Candidatus Neomarinimicrobiota bacterium]
MLNLTFTTVKLQSKHKDLTIYLLNQLYRNITVDFALNGFDGYIKIHENNPKIVILDLVMPGITGLDFLRNIKLNNKLNSLKVLIVSAYLDDSMRRELKKLGVDGIITKPVNKAELKEKCDELLGVGAKQ